MIRALEVFGAALRLGVSSFGGPVAHLGYFREEYVRRRGWLDDRAYGELVALCQLLPGPASSELGIAIGLIRAGWAGGLLAWAGFTLPSAIAMVAFAYATATLGPADLRWLRGLQVVAVAIVAQAVWTMGRSLAPDRPRLAIALGGAVVALAAPGAVGQVGTIAAGGLVGALALRRPGEESEPLGVVIPVGRRVGAVALGLVGALLVGLPLLRRLVHSQALAAFDSFFRSGALVFGGGHVVLPLLRTAVVTPGWVTSDRFLTGYGAAQAVPGPLFTFSAYLGAVMHGPPGGVPGAALALVAIFLPAFLLVVGALPFWRLLHGAPAAGAALRGVNAAVVGLLLAALYDPVFTGAVRSAADFGLALAAFGLLTVARAPAWAVVLLTTAAGAGLVALGR
ncbi:MAG TPA: chromate efflux transporter [Candidatus Dormibacteraeota bacterium]|nr:chromate efflux transporter [Candidatus Dormibacteraeota bacterium]